MIRVLIKRGTWTWRQTHTGSTQRVNTKAAIRVMHLHTSKATDCQPTAEAGRGAGHKVSLTEPTAEATSSASTLI